MDGGYVHAPGLTHAATAGVLRSGRLTHRRGDPNNEALDIDLSSTRVRDALALLDGMRRGSRWARCSATGSSAGCTTGPTPRSSWTASSTCCARSRRCAPAS